MSSPPTPSYETVTANSATEVFAGHACHTLILDACLIYAESDPSRPLYEVTNPPSEAKSNVYGIQKVRYRQYYADGKQDVLRPRHDHIYDCRVHEYWSGRDLLPSRVRLDGKTSRKRSYKEVIVAPSTTGSWSACEAKSHFKAKKKDGDHVAWKDMRGTVVAVETVLKRKEKHEGDGSPLELTRLPKLDVREAMEEIDLDLLVSCWVARVWKEAQGDLKEPMSWEDCKFLLFCDFLFRSFASYFALLSWLFGGGWGLLGAVDRLGEGLKTYIVNETDV